MDELIIRWRHLADVADAESESPSWYGALRMCADELEQAWHDHAHDGTWSPERCAICVEEMKEYG